jgi:serine/threonine protein kinase
MENLIGKQLGAYRVEAPLGEGGMAAVYMGYQPAMDRYVALKILPQQMPGDTEFTARFQQEARVVARLQHPHILPVFDYGEVDGLAYLVMPLVMGGTLAGLMRGQPLPLSQLRMVVNQVGDALDYAHSQGVIHRDVKPGNVLLDERGNCLLTDFGLAKIMQAAPGLSASGGIIGTPTYMSPEQGQGRTLDGRSDVYSLGVILYEMAVGRPPFMADTPIATVVKHINDSIPPPREVNPALPEPVERVILKSLAKEPDDRYPTARAMVLDWCAAIPDMLAGPSPVDSENLPPAVASETGMAPSAVLAAVPLAVPAEPDQAGVAASPAPPPSVSSDDATPRWPAAPGPKEATEAVERPAAPTPKPAGEQPLSPPLADRSAPAGSRRRLWVFVLLTALGWAVSGSVATWLAVPAAVRLQADSDVAWLLVAGAFSGLWLGAALLMSGERRMNAGHMLFLGLVGTVAGVCLPRGILALEAAVVAGCAGGLVAHWVEPKLPGSRALAVAGGWVVSLFLGGVVFELASRNPQLPALILAMTASGVCAAAVLAWQLHQGSKAQPAAEGPAAEAAGQRPARRVSWLGRIGCLGWVLLALGIIGYRGYRVVIPASDCARILQFSTARDYAQLAERVTQFSTSDRIIPVIENDLFWLTSCGSQWSRPPMSVEVKLVDAQNNVPVSGSCDSVWLQKTACGDFNPIRSLPAGNYQMEFWYNSQRLQSLPLTLSR